MLAKPAEATALTAAVAVRLLHTAIGAVTESDVSLAIPSNALVVAFRVGVLDKGRVLADRSGIEIRPYEVIYELLDDVREGLTCIISVRLREPQFEGQTKTKLGNTEIRSFVLKYLNQALPECADHRAGTTA